MGSIIEKELGKIFISINIWKIFQFVNLKKYWFSILEEGVSFTNVNTASKRSLTNQHASILVIFPLGLFWDE